MWLLYELGIIVAGMLGRRAAQQESLDDAPGAGGGT
jgi:Sec-independent protein secretion pathway component TatC